MLVPHHSPLVVPVVLAFVAGASLAPAQTTLPAQVQETVKAEDPQAYLKDFEHQAERVDLATVPLDERLAATMALNELLIDRRTKLRERVDSLHNYLTESNLKGELATATAADPPAEPVDFDEALGIAVAYVRTPQGRADWEVEGGAGDPEMRARSEASYRKLARSAWDEINPLRTEAHRIARFLRDRGKMEEYVQWHARTTAAAKAKAEAELEQRRAEYRQQLAQAEAQVEQNVINSVRQREQNRIDRLSSSYDSGRSRTRSFLNDDWDGDDDVSITLPATSSPPRQ